MSRKNLDRSDRNKFVTSFIRLPTWATKRGYGNFVTFELSDAPLPLPGQRLSKKAENHIHAVALYFLFYHFTRIHKTLRMSPAMAAGLADRFWSPEDVVAKVDEWAPASKPHGPYKKREK